MKERTFRRMLARVDRHPALTDAAIAAGFVAFGLAWLPLAWPATSPVSPIVAVVLVLALFAPLAWRRRRPLATLVVVTVVVAVYALSGLPQNSWFANGWLLAAYSAGSYGGGRWRSWVRAGAAVAFTALIVADTAADGGVPGGPGSPGNPVLGLGLLTATTGAFVAWVWLFGDAARAAREGEAELAERTRQLEQEREANAHRAVLDERVRIARELHDVVAHHVSLMGLQAGAARLVLDRRPEKVGETLAAIEASSREAVREMQRLLGFLRQDRDDDPLAPQPGIGQIETLVAQMRTAGLAVTLEIGGTARPLPPSVDLSAYRIVQEALTNTLKHAGPTAATVGIRYGERALDLEIADDGGAPPPAAVNGGNGLIGMRERVGLLGGELHVGRRPQGGFAVRARLPLDGGPR